MRLDPVFTQQYLHFLGPAYLVAGQYAIAAAAFRERIRLAPKTDLSRAFSLQHSATSARSTKRGASGTN